MPEPIQRLLELPSGYRSSAVARAVWQLDDQSRRLKAATAALRPAALEWQPAPGFSTLGMLLAHVAVAEAHMTAVLLEGREHSDVASVIGIRMEDDGMPLPSDGHPPAALANQGIEFFHSMLERARQRTRRVAQELTDADLDRRIVRHLEDGTTRIYNVDWALYHLVEHIAGHHAQVLQLMHLHDRRAGA